MRAAYLVSVPAENLFQPIRIVVLFAFHVVPEQCPRLASTSAHETKVAV